MPFKPNDPNINRAGRKPTDPNSKKITNREIKERELVSILRKLKPHVAEAILQASRIMQNNAARHQDQLKAATIILDNYRRITLDVYDGESEDEDATIDVQPQNNPVFSLKVVNTE